MKEMLHRFIDTHPQIAGLAAEVITAIPQLEVIQYKASLLSARKWLDHGSLLIYFGPHTCLYDPALVTQRIVVPYLTPPDPEHFAWLTSSKFTGAVTGKPTMGAASTASIPYAQKMGFQILPLVQSYQLDDVQHDETFRFAASKNNTASMLKAREILRKSGGIVGVSPEGTRVDTGGLIRGQNSIRLLLKGRNVAALPVILHGVHRMQAKKDEGLNGLHPFIKIRACIGEPLTYQDAQTIASQHRWKDAGKGEFTATDALMLHLASYGLSTIIDGVDPRGEYAWENLERVIYPNNN